MMIDDLTERKCKPCEGGVPPLEAEAARELLAALDPALVDQCGRQMDPP